MPDTEADVWQFISTVGVVPKWDYDKFAVIERVGGYVPNARGGQPGSAMFKFGHSYGGLRMALIAAGIPFEEVMPRTWQKAMGIAVKGKDETATSFKNRLKQRAQQLFPSEKITLATADALLIAEYCRRLRKGLLK